MKNTIVKIVCCTAVLLILTGCGTNKTSDHTIADSRTASSDTTETADQATDIMYPQGDMPRVYITTANYANKLNSNNNLTLDKRVAVRSCETDSLKESNLVDGNMDTRWASGYEDDEYFIIDLGKPKKFSYITMNWENAYGKEYTISVSEDNSNWTQIIDEENGSIGEMQYSFEEVSAKYIKWQGIKRGTEYGYSLYEFCVYKDSAASEPAAIANISDYPYLTQFTEVHQPVSIAIADSLGGSNELIRDNGATIKIRGNSTALTNKKSYNFKLSSKEDVLGLGEGKKWCLLANHFDKTLLRNKISYNFANALDLPVTLDTIFVDVYIDGVYEGNFLLSEPVSDGKNRVDIDINNGEYIIERCVYVDTAPAGTFVSPVYKLDFAFKAPDADEVTAEQITQLEAYLSKAEEAMKSGDRAAIEEVIDLNSFASMYVFEELFKNIDYTFDSNYFYIKGGKLYAGPIWDMDLSMGNASYVYEFEPYYIYNNSVVNGITYGNGSGDSTQGSWAKAGWYEVLMNYAFFNQLVSAKFDLVEAPFEELYAAGGVIDSLLKQYSSSFERNYSDTYWDITKTYSKYERETPDDTYVANVEYLKSWLKKRKEWVYNNR